MAPESDSSGREGGAAAAILNLDSPRGDRVSDEQRQRTSHACDNCRRRKGRCRREHRHALKCDHCGDFDLECSYLHPGLGRGIRRKRRRFHSQDHLSSHRQDSFVQLIDTSLPATTSQGPSSSPRHATSARIVDQRTPNDHLLSGSEEAPGTTPFTSRVLHGASIDHSPSPLVYTFENAQISPPSQAGDRQVAYDRNPSLHLANSTSPSGPSELSTELPSPRSMLLRLDRRSEALECIVEESVHAHSASFLIRVSLTQRPTAIAYISNHTRPSLTAVS